jgi:hypothetical protein
MSPATSSATARHDETVTTTPGAPELSLLRALLRVRMEEDARATLDIHPDLLERWEHAWRVDAGSTGAASRGAPCRRNRVSAFEDPQVPQTDA